MIAKQYTYWHAVAMLKAAIYTRISIDPDGRSTATARQLADCRALLASRGWEETGIYEDPDISAYARKVVRPAFERLKEDVREGRVEAVVGWKLDRLFRRTRDFSDLDEICEVAGARIVTVVDAIDTGTSAGRLVATVMTGMARTESENISIRARRKAVEMARDGLSAGGGQRMFGYERGMRGIVPEEAAQIRDAVRRLLEGESMYSICREWNARGLRTSGGKSWGTTTLSRLVRSHQLAGQRFHRGVVSTAQWDGVISPAEHQALLRLFQSRVRGKARPRTHYLTGLLRCAVCDGPIRAQRTGSGKRGYGCGNFHILRKADPLEEYVRDMLFERIESPAFLELAARQSAPTGDVDALMAEIRGDELALEELAHDRYVARVIGPAEHASASSALTARLEGNRKRLAQMAPSGPGVDLGTVRAQWPEQSAEWRGRVAASVIERVTAGPSPLGRLPFHSASITIHWRF